MAAVDLVLRRSTRIAQHPHHHHHHPTTKRRPLNNPEIIEEGESSTSENDELTPRALRALKRQRLALDSDGLLLPHIETQHRRKRRKENDNINVGHGSVGEVRRRMRQVRVRTRAQNVPKPRHIPPLAPTIIDLPIQPVTAQESLRNVLTDQPSILAPKDDESKSEHKSTTESTEPKPTEAKSSTPLDLDSLIPLDPLPEFPPHEPPFTNPPDFVSNATFSPGTELNPFASNTPFGSSQFGSNPFPSNPAPFPTGFSHEFIPQPDFSPSQDNPFSNTAFPAQEYTSGYNQSNGYPQQATFSQPNSFDYTPAPHRDREVNIWKLACQERVEFLLRRYGIDTIKALVASEARARFPSPSTHPSNTRFRLYTPASYLERASYTYKSAEFEAIDFDMDDEEDEDEDLDECDLGADYDDDYDDDEEDAEGEDSLFLMDVESAKGTAAPCVPAIVTPTVPTVPSILPPVASLPPTTQKQPTSSRSTSPPALGGRYLLDAMPTPRPLCASPPCSPPRRTPSPPQRLSTPATPPTTSTPIQTPPSTPVSPSTPTPPPSRPTPTPQTPPLIHSPQTPSSTPPQTPPHTHQPTLPRTPPLSSLHVTLLSEPPRAFMGRGTPPDRRRLSEWGRWGCVQVYGKGGERRRLSLGHGGDHMHLHHGQCGERLGMGMEQLRKEDITRHENPPPLQLTEHQPPHTPQQHEDPRPHPHPNPHEDPPHTHTHTHAVPGEWTSFLFAMLEGDGTGSAGWYELGAQSVQGGGEGMGGGGVPQSMNMSVLGGAQDMVGAQAGLSGTPSLGMGAQSLGMGMGGQGMGIGMGPMAQTVSIGEADSTLRFALG